ncbi:hypothetical protein [Thalassobacillus sp. CUG 92003]|uniref:hypothetical protein n=1 Tax=Thalassobacillus sp. CUG 92003 TaxID=2736641 RepID=UPI0015E66D90|nr:hypothetical protein [Thalassobacillus sp. CUG 92003]
MSYFGSENFSIFMWKQYEIDIDEEQVGEESILLYKEELDEGLVSKEMLEFTPDLVLVQTCSYETKVNEWIVSVAADADTNYPLFLICLKDGKKIYEELLSRGEEE